VAVKTRFAQTPDSAANARPAAPIDNPINGRAEDDSTWSDRRRQRVRGLNCLRQAGVAAL
jgi:hypothetical protein